MENLQVSAYMNNRVRPVAHKLRDLSLYLQSFRSEWYSEIVPILNGFPQGEVIVDGRLAEGIAPLTIGQLQAFMGEALKTAPEESNSWNFQILEGVCFQNPSL